MKIRSGFVSNSSSSSFLLVGVRKPLEQFAKLQNALESVAETPGYGAYEVAEHLGHKGSKCEGLCLLYDENSRYYILGVKIVDFYDDTIKEVQVNDILAAIDKVSKFLKEAGIEGNPAILSGSICY